MKKIILIILILSVSLFAFVGCTPAEVPALAWASTETITYEVTDNSSGDSVIRGTMTIVLQRLDAGSYTLDGIPDKTFDITSTGIGGTKQTITFKSIDGATLYMQSTSLLNGFAPLASTKTVNFDSNNYQTTNYVEGNNYHYEIINGGKVNSGKTKYNEAAVDNEHMYTYLRCYEIEKAGFQKPITLYNAAFSGTETINATYASESKITLGTDIFGKGKKDIDCIKYSFVKSSSPVGGASYAYYSVYNDNQYLASSYNTKSYRLPIKIEENNLTYTIKSIEAK